MLGSSNDVDEGPADLATVVAAVVAPPGIFDEERQRGIDALNMRASLGTEGDAVLALVAASEDGARLAAPLFSWPAEGAEATEPEGLRSGFVKAIGAPPPDGEIRDVLPGALDNVGRGDGAVHQGPDTTTASEMAGGRTATTTTTTTWDGSIQGSVVTLAVRRDVHSVITGPDGSTVLDKTDRYVVSLPTSLTHAMVTAPDYGAEAPLEVSQQQSVRHTEEVDTSSTTTFEADVKHRFGGTVTAPIKADLSGGKETLTPGSISPPPGD